MSVQDFCHCPAKLIQNCNGVVTPSLEGTRNIDERLRQVFMLTERVVDRAIDHDRP
jgi:hypothetical protein